MPSNRGRGVQALIEKCAEYYQLTKRRVTFEYIMLNGINDSVDQAKELSSLLKGMNAYVNLIPYNEVIEKPYKRSLKDIKKELNNSSFYLI